MEINEVVALIGMGLIFLLFIRTIRAGISHSVNPFFGNCNACHVGLGKENMPDGPCLDSKWYCKNCLMRSRCGCDSKYYFEEEPNA